MYAVVHRVLSTSTARSFVNFSLLAREQKPYRRKTRALDAVQRQTLGESAHRNMERNLNSPAAAGNEERRLFAGCQDRYNGLLVDSSLEPCENLHFAKCLEDSLKRWRSEDKATIWFRVYLANADWIPALVKEGFKFHHAKEDYATLYKWLPTKIHSNIPPYAHTNLGVGGFVLNDETGEILVVKDKRSVLDGPTRWKLPGGIVDPGENIPDAVMREVREETGILTEFDSLLGFRHAHGYGFGCSDIYVVARLKPLTREIQKCEREIADCTWMKLEEYANDPSIVQNNRILAQAMLQYTKNRSSLKLIDGEHPLTKKPVWIYLISTE